MAYRYKTVKINGKTTLLHRHVAEHKIGRKLVQGEHVNHINGDRHDNRPENLEVVSHKDHMHEHKQVYPLSKLCENCGAEFTPHPTKRKRAKCCTKKCGYELRWKTRRAAALVKANVNAATLGRREVA